MIGKDFNSLIDLVKEFPTEQSCIDHLTGLRWNGYVVSPFDPTSKVYKCKGNKYRCKNTGKYFNVRTNTLFDNTKIELIKWFMAIWLVTAHKKGISSLQLSRDIDVTQKTAWFMLQRIIKKYPSEDNQKALGLWGEYKIIQERVYRDRDSYKPEFLGWKISHKYRARNQYNALMLREEEIHFDKDLTKIINIVSVGE